MIDCRCRDLLGKLFVGLVVIGGLAGCGHKADLFLPGEPKKVDQLSKPVIESMKREAKETLDGQELPDADEPADSSQIESDSVEVQLLETTQEIVKKKKTQ